MPKTKNFFKKTWVKNRLFSVVTLVILVSAVIAGIILVKQNQNIKEQARDCECDQYSSCGSGYRCSNQTCGKCVKDSTPPPVGGSGGGNSAKKSCNEQGGQCLTVDDQNSCKTSAGTTSDCRGGGQFCCLDSNTGGGNDGGSGSENGEGGGQGGGSGGVGGIIERFLQFFFASIDIKGGVKDGNIKFTKETCTGTDFLTDAGMNATAKHKDKTLTAVWDCIGPDFTFYQKRVRSGNYTINLVPPAGFSCSTITVKNRSTNETVKSGTGCSIDITLKGKTAPMYVQYEVVK